MAAAPGSWVLAEGDVTGDVAPAGLGVPEAGGAPPWPGGNPEIDQPWPVVGQKHIRRLQVTMHYSGGMYRAQALGQSRG
jgi:hypothetical protein